MRISGYSAVEYNFTRKVLTYDYSNKVELQGTGRFYR